MGDQLRPPPSGIQLEGRRAALRLKTTRAEVVTNCGPNCSLKGTDRSRRSQLVNYPGVFQLALGFRPSSHTTCCVGNTEVPCQRQPLVVSQRLTRLWPSEGHSGSVSVFYLCKPGSLRARGSK